VCGWMNGPSETALRLTKRLKVGSFGSLVGQLGFCVAERLLALHYSFANFSVLLYLSR